MQALRDAVLQHLSEGERRWWLQALHGMVPDAKPAPIKLSKDDYVCLFMLGGFSYVSWERYTTVQTALFEHTGAATIWFPKHSAMKTMFHAVRRQLLPDSALVPVSRDPDAPRGLREAQVCIGSKALLEAKLTNVYAAHEARDSDEDARVGRISHW